MKFDWNLLCIEIRFRFRFRLDWIGFTLGLNLDKSNIGFYIRCTLVSGLFYIEHAERLCSNFYSAEVKMKAWFCINDSFRTLIHGWPVLAAAVLAICDSWTWRRRRCLVFLIVQDFCRSKLDIVSCHQLIIHGYWKNNNAVLKKYTLIPLQVPFPCLA